MWSGETSDVLLWVGWVLFGLVMGSFLNVLIYRLPLRLSVVSPRSFCPQCKARLGWRDLVPVVSYLVRRSRCRFCNERIALQYPLVEMAALGILVLCLLRFSFPESLMAAFFLWGLLVCTVVDLRHGVIPTEVVLSLALLGLMHALWQNSLWDALGGMILGGGLLFAVSWAYRRVRSRVGLGMGDVKLLAAIGAYVGISGTVFTLLGASFVGLVGILPFLFQKRLRLDSAIPFAPALAMAALLVVISGR